MKKAIILILITIILSTNAIALAIEYPFPDLEIQKFDKYGNPVRDRYTGELVFEPHYALNEITKLTKIGMVNGYPDGKFYPEETMTKAEYIKMVIVLATNRTFEFNNIPVNIQHWAAPYVYVAEMQGVINKGQYDVEALNKPITRIEMACILSNVQIRMKDVPQNRQGQLQYTDIDNLTQDEKDLLLHAAKYTLLSDDMLESSKFEPNKNITRAEAAVSMIRIY